MVNTSKQKLALSQLVLHESLQILNFDPWKVIARKSVDWHKDAQTPNISMMLFVNAKTHVYTLNVLHRTYQEGQIKDMTHLDTIIQRFFDQTSPCYGFSQSSDVPYQFAQDCKIFVYGNETICDKCQDQIVSIKEFAEDLSIFVEGDPEEESQLEDQKQACVDLELVETVLQDDPEIDKLFLEKPKSVEEEVINSVGHDSSKEIEEEMEVMDLAEHGHSKEKEKQLEIDATDPTLTSLESNSVKDSMETENEPSAVGQRSSRRLRKNKVKYGDFLADIDDKDDFEDQPKRKTKPKDEEDEQQHDDEFVPEGDTSNSEGEEIEGGRQRRAKKYFPRGYQIVPLSENDSRFPCPYCNLLLKSTSSFKSHLRFHTYNHRNFKRPNRPSKHPKLHCSHCESEFRLPKALARHLQKEHNASVEEIQDLKPKYQCWICLKVLNCSATLQTHKKEEHLLGNWQCLFCKEKPRHGKEIVKHYEANHRTSNYKILCIICHENLCFTKGFHVIEDHWKLCYQQWKQDQVAAQNKRQKKSIEKTKKNMCDQCGKSFYLKTELIEHQNEHKGIYNHQCPDCDYKTAFKNHFRKHRLYKHAPGITKVYEYVPCEFCGKIVNTNTMSGHIVRCHSEPTLPCEQCQKLFTTRGMLNKHIRTVHGKKIPAQCKDCGIFLKTEQVLSQHMLTHVPPKFTCRFCGKGLKTRLSLGNHERIHTKENPYKCDQCAFACATAGNLLLHKKRKHDLQKKVFHIPVEIP